MKVHLISMKRCSSLDPQLFNIIKRSRKKGPNLDPLLFNIIKRSRNGPAAIQYHKKVQKRTFFSRYNPESPSYKHEALFKFWPYAIQYHKKVQKKGSKLWPSAFQYHEKVQKRTFSRDMIIKVHLISMKRCSSLYPLLFMKRSRNKGPNYIMKRSRKKGPNLDPLLFNIMKWSRKGPFSRDMIMKVHLISMHEAWSYCFDPLLFNIIKRSRKEGPFLDLFLFFSR